MIAADKLLVDVDATELEMATTILGAGVTVVGVRFVGDDRASGIYEDGENTAPMLTPSDRGVVLSTGDARDVTNASGDANQSPNSGTDFGEPGDTTLAGIANTTTFDAASFEIDFDSQGDTLTMQFVFASEEYLEWVGSGFNDAFAVFVNNQKIDLTFGSGDVTINNINDVSNSNLFINNPAGNEVANTEMDGLTLTLSLKAPVSTTETNTIRFAIADGGDGIYDSNILIGEGSVQSSLIANDDSASVQSGGEVDLDLTANDESTAVGTLTVIEINGEPVVLGQTITLPSGDEVTLTSEGMITFNSTGGEGINAFSYTVQDSLGTTDIAFVQVLETAPCFVAGSRVATANGEVPIESLVPGQLVLTRDSCMQPVRWIGFAERHALGKDAPVRITAGTLGNHDTVEVSQNHRVLISNPKAELVFGNPEVLVLAKELVNGTTVNLREDGRPVTYVHLLFDDHEIVTVNGLLSESYHPGEETLRSFSSETKEELERLMPDLPKRLSRGRYPAARRSLKRYEAAYLLS